MFAQLLRQRPGSKEGPQRLPLTFGVSGSGFGSWLLGVALQVFCYTNYGLGFRMFLLFFFVFFEFRFGFADSGLWVYADSGLGVCGLGLQSMEQRV